VEDEMQTVTLAGARTPSTSGPENHVIVLFGATGDLAKRRLLPGLFRLASADLMPERYQIIGSARRGRQPSGAPTQFRNASDTRVPMIDPAQ
jgi:glucose-6-phosphate 1-dehydrogenase